MAWDEMGPALKPWPCECCVSAWLGLYFLDVLLQQLVVHFDLVLELLPFELQEFGIFAGSWSIVGFVRFEYSCGIVR